ncbi:hypothetical protein CYMTET_32893 [Cymbomonas tetramitiformis]|uniref:Uncharacterized protein n=1 Tax=Cymbomonas tetramitiformis TaxID=36881 RepID=A0AAE0FEI0_9CHLO|nr:hypothetical protein CYMTET_32893 [Cymbomonas tetramitiformis]
MLRGLDLASFEFDDLTKQVIPKVNEPLYDTFAYIVKTDSAAEHLLLGTDSVSDKDRRRELYWNSLRGPSVAGTAYSGVDERIVQVLGQLTSRIEKIEAAIKFQKVGGRRPGVLSLFATSAAERGVAKRAAEPCKECPYGGRGATGGTTAFYIPADGEGAAEAMHTLALCQIFQVAADDGAEAFAAAVAEYAALAVLAGGESEGIDVSAYGFAVSNSGSGVLAELETLTGQVKAMEEKVGVHPSHVSLVDDGDVDAHRTPVSALSAAGAMAGDAPR